MNTNLRSMIDAALDGQYSEQQQSNHGYIEAPSYDLSQYEDNVGVIKLAHALVHVADNLQDIGSPEEKLAELEAFSHIVEDLNPQIEDGELKLAGYEDFDGLGAYVDADQYDDSLYGARQRALVKMASAYGIPAEHLDEMLKESSAFDRAVAFLGKTRVGKAVAKRSGKAADAVAKAESNVAKLKAQGAAKAEVQVAKAELEAAKKMKPVTGDSGETFRTLRQIKAESTATQNLGKAKAGQARADKAVDSAPIGISGRIREQAVKRQLAKTPAAPKAPTGGQPKAPPAQPQGGAPTGGQPKAPAPPAAPPAAQPKAAPKTPAAPNPLAPPPKNIDLTKVDLKNAPVTKAPTAEPKGFLDKTKDFMAQPGLGNMNMGQTIGAGAGLVGGGAILGSALSGGNDTTVVKAASLRKLAEDRINPAKIIAGKSDPFSGHDIHAPGMSRSASPYEPITVKAQRIRDLVNRDMTNYVDNVGGGYNLRKYLNR